MSIIKADIFVLIFLAKEKHIFQLIPNSLRMIYIQRVKAVQGMSKMETLVLNVYMQGRGKGETNKNISNANSKRAS